MTTTTAPPSTSTTSGLSSPITQLKMASAFTVGFGLLIALGSHTLTDGPLRAFADVIFWPTGDSVQLSDESQLLAAVLGGVMASWGVLFFMLTTALGRTQPALLKRLVLVTLTSWFLVDSAGSIASGGWLNVIPNVGFLALFILPARRL